MDPRRSTTDIPPPQSAALGLHPVAGRLLLINRPLTSLILKGQGRGPNIFDDQYLDKMALKYI